MAWPVLRDVACCQQTPTIEDSSREVRMMATLPPGACTPESEFYARVAAVDHVPLPMAIEHAQVICRALGEVMSRASRSRLARHLPSIGLLFEPPEPSEPPVHAVAPPAQHDLAEGAPGSRHPLADADPTVLAHRHSVSRNPDPHAEVRLSGRPFSSPTSPTPPSRSEREKRFEPSARNRAAVPEHREGATYGEGT